jgi:integrase
MEFMLLTLLRRDEVCDTCWRDIDLDAATLTIIPEKTKNRQPHVVPLSCQAVALLRTMHTRSGGTAQHQPEALVFATSTGSGLVNWDRETKRIMLQAGLPRRIRKPEPSP